MSGRTPQPNRPEDGEQTVAFGIAALDSELTAADVSYPTDRLTLLETVGDVAVPYNAAGRTIALSEALEQVPRTEFETKQQLLNDLHPVFETARREHSNPWLDRLRSVFPS